MTPKLAIDFTTAILDNRVSVARASNTATVTNSSGYIVGVNVDLPRFLFDPITLTCNGLLIEESSVNYCLYSEAFDVAAAWSPSDASVTADAATAPSNATTADKLVENTATVEHALTQSITYAPNNTVTLSLYAKASGRNLRILMSDFTTGVVYAVYDLSNGTYSQQVTSGSWSSLSPSITHVGNGWYRCVLTATKGAGSGVAAVLTLHDGSTTAYAGDGSSGVYLWGAQFEPGDEPSSYIPTSSSSVTRNADVVSLSGTSFSSLYNPLSGTWAVHADARSGATILTAGSFTLAADVTALKKYAASYTSDQAATSLVLGTGTVRELQYFSQALTPSDLQLVKSPAGYRSMIQSVMQSAIIRQEFPV